MEDVTKDANGNVLVDGDNVQLTKDLKAGGSSISMKRGEVMKNIRLTSNPAEIECKVGKATIVIKTCFLKKR